MTKLNIGCGADIHPDFINLDIYPFPGVNVVHDITKPFPFEDASFSEVHANHILEHIVNLIPLMNELYRVLAPAGILNLAVPWWAGEWARGDPTHIRFFDHNSFNPFSDWHHRYAFLGIAGPWSKISQTYQEDPAFNTNPWLARAGFSPILAMLVILQRGP